MSLLGFNDSIKKLDSMERKFLREGMKLAQKEFDNNFNKRSNSETGALWSPVKRHVPPEILEVTGRLRNAATRTGNVSYIGKRAILTVDPIDENGNGYAKYHQDGIGRVKERAYLTQSEDLTSKQINKLYDCANEIF